MTKVEEISKEELLTLKAIQLFPLLPMAIYILIIVIIQTMVIGDGESSMVGSSFIFTLVTVILGIIGIATLVLAYFLPQWIINSCKKKSQPPPGLIVTSIFRAVCFLFTSILGLVMAILSGWIAMMLLFLAIFMVMILTFPNKERLNKLVEGDDYNSG